MAEGPRCRLCGQRVTRKPLSQHVRETHETEPTEEDMAAEEEYRSAVEAEGGQAFSKDEPPKAPKRDRSRRSSSGAIRAKAPSGVPLSVQLQLPYELGAMVLNSRGRPQTAQAVMAQAPACAAAWDRFLLRFPALREMIEKGAVGADVVALIMAHVPILEAARAEAYAIAVAEGRVPPPGAADDAVGSHFVAA